MSGGTAGPGGDERTDLARGPAVLARLFGVVDRISEAAAALAAVLLVLMVGHVMFEIALRAFFQSSTHVLDEFVGYGVAAMTFLALGHALNRRALIRVDIVRGQVGPRLKRVLEFLCIGFGLFITGFLGWYIGRNLMRNIERGSVSETIAEVPLWIPQSAVFLGICLFGLQLVTYALRLIFLRRQTDLL